MATPILAENLKGLNTIRHGFFTREGGVSGGVYAGLNVGLGSKDDRANIMENRNRVANTLDQPDQPLNTLYQVHSATAVTIDAPFAGSPPEADAVVTTVPGVIIGALAADCTPVLFADPEAGVIGAAHAGWRGALSGILEATLEAMLAAGAHLESMRAAIGPTINQTSYEVGPEFALKFTSENAQFERFFETPTPSGRPHFNLPGFVEHRLAAAGVSSIATETHCTYENESRFFSYRRATHRGEPDYGRQISAIVLA